MKKENYDGFLKSMLKGSRLPMAKDSKTSEDFYRLLQSELKICLNPYNKEKHLKHMEKAMDFQEWCSHTFNNGNSAIESGFDEDSSETWSQCKLCMKNFD